MLISMPLAAVLDTERLSKSAVLPDQFHFFRQAHGAITANSYQQREYRCLPFCAFVVSQE